MLFGKDNLQTDCKSFYDLKAEDIHHQEVTFDQFKGKVVLVVNVASK